MPPLTVDTIAPVASLPPRNVGVVNSHATMPDRKPPSSFDVPIKSAFTAETRPRFSSGVRICTSVCRTMTLTLSTAPASANVANANQNQKALGIASKCPRQFWFATPNRIVATPKMATDNSIARPAFCIGGRCAMMNMQITAPMGIAFRSQP